MPRPLPSRAQILSCLGQARRPLHAREIAQALGVMEGSGGRLSELLDQLCLDGAVQCLGGRRYKARPLEEQKATWEGLLTVNPRGFGFVAAAGHDDVFVPADSIGPALHGDRVRVSLVGRSERGTEGRIEDVVERRSPRVAGVLRCRGKSRWLEPDDTRIRGPVVLLPGPVEGRDGEAAVAHIQRFPRYAEEAPEGQLVAVLGAPGGLEAEVAKILIREQINEEHPLAAVQQAEQEAASLLFPRSEHRRDLRQVPLPTIDPEDARDHDDALWIEKRGNGYRAYVAIADVAEYVKPATPLDDEARSRGCTLYLPDRAIPMLPTALAADRCSLLPEQDRLCLCVIADLDASANVESFEIVEGVMRSAAMLTYDGVARTLGFTPDGPTSVQAEALRPGLRLLDDLARKLHKLRLARGALDLDLPEARIVLDEKTGQPRDVVRRARDPGVKRAYQMVEELMLLANQLVAQWLSTRRSVAIYRVHGPPDAEKLERLGELAQELGVKLDTETLLEPKGLARWLERIAQHPRKTALELLTLRSLKQAQYDIVNIGHFGLASDTYLHFTSPIRRYPDLAVHRIVKHLLRGGKPKNASAEVEEQRALATLSSQRERAAMVVEREVVDLHRCMVMQHHLGKQFTGTVTAVVGGGLFVALESPFVDVMVRMESLGPDRYELTDNELSVRGLRSGEVIRLGDALCVEIEDVAVLRRTVYARRVVAAAPAQRSKGQRGAQRGQRRRQRDESSPQRPSRHEAKGKKGPRKR